MLQVQNKMRNAGWNEAILVHVYISLNPVQHNFYRCVASNRYTLIIDFLLFYFCLFVFLKKHPFLIWLSFLRRTINTVSNKVTRYSWSHLAHLLFSWYEIVNHEKIFPPMFCTAGGESGIKGQVKYGFSKLKMERIFIQNDYINISKS